MIWAGAPIAASLIRRASLAVAVLAAVALSSTPAAGAEGVGPANRLAVSEGSGAVFPGRALVLSVPAGGTVSSTQVHVAENGRPVQETIVTPIADAAAHDFGIVLAIDVSPSMTGAPLHNAMIAARALAAERTGQQELGVIQFDQTPTVTLPLTTDASAITRTLAHAPTVGGGTHIYDALAVALQQLRGARVAAGAVILLSDGADRGSTNAEQSVAAAARAAHVSLYTVGVRDPAFDSSSLQMLARDGGGQYLVTDSSGLQQLFTGLEASLTSRYVIHYRSEEPAGTQIGVRVTVDGVPGAASLSYVSPSLAGAHTARRSTSHSFWVSSAALISLSIGAALLLGFGTVAFLAPRVRRDALRRRVARFTAAGPSTESGQHQAGVRRLASLERLLEKTGWWDRFSESVEIAGFDRSAVELVALCAAATFAAIVVIGAGLGSWVLAMLALILGPLSLQSVVRRRLRKQRALFQTQLPSHLQELASAMRAGHSVASGINAMAKSASEPSRAEWSRVVADEQLGVPLDAAMRPLGERMDCQDIEQVALVADLQHRSGGNMADVIDRVAEGVRDRADLRRELDALTAQARLSRWVVTALPAVVLGALALIRPHYVAPLFDSSGGQIMLGVAIVLIIIGSLVMRAITEIKA